MSGSATTAWMSLNAHKYKTGIELLNAAFGEGLESKTLTSLGESYAGWFLEHAKILKGEWLHEEEHFVLAECTVCGLLSEGRGGNWAMGEKFPSWCVAKCKCKKPKDFNDREGFICRATWTEHK